MREVHCTQCQWEGTVSQLNEYTGTFNRTYRECPSCGSRYWDFSKNPNKTTDLVEHYQFFIATENVRIWGDVFATTEGQAFNYVTDMFPWLLDSDRVDIHRFKLEWEDTRPEISETGIVNFNSWHQRLTLER